MISDRYRRTLGVSAALLSLAYGAAAASQALSGSAAYGDWRNDAPGTVRKFTPADMPAPFATPSARKTAGNAERPAEAKLKTMPGFAVSAWATALDGPRTLRFAPNGDLFVVESHANRISVLRPNGSGAPERFTFAEGLKQPFGLALYPARNPKWVYVGDTDQVLRFPYKIGDTKASGAAQPVSALANGAGHWTRDVAFSPDGKRMYVSVGSGSNVAETMTKKSPKEITAWEASHGLGASWDAETNRAAVLVSDPMGKGMRPLANGIRNCVGLTIHPASADVWCTTNERDGLGDNLVPDYSTRVREGGFYGWPWYYIGDHEDPRHAGERPDLVGKITVPDVLYQPHSAPLALTFYDGHGPAAFPSQFNGDGFAVLHGSWNRENRTGYKVIRVKMKGARPTGEYQDFVTGFVVDGEKVWGRPNGVTIAPDGALLVSDDVGGVIWRVAPDKVRK